jgi:prepilin-type N-terminal cleavage/methylation domain-containing protein
VTRILRRLRRVGGYTLTEMLVVMSILGVVLGGLTTLFVSASNAELDMNFRWQAQQNARLSLDKLRREIHCASSVSTIASETPSGPLAAYGIVLVLPTGCNNGGVDVTWCTQAIDGASDRFGLFRVSDSAACDGGTKYADYLTSPDVFGYTPASGSLAKVDLDIPVNVDPQARPNDAYELKDDIVLRNSIRG